MIHTLFTPKRVFEKGLCIFRNGLLVPCVVFVLFCIIGLPVALQAQNNITLTNAPSFQIKSYSVLPDAKYGFRQVLEDPSLVFKSDSLNAATVDAYWIKIAIENPYPNDENYLVSLSIPLNYVLYSYKIEDKKWVAQAAGLNVTDRRRLIGLSPIILRPRVKNVFYLKIDLQDVKPFSYKMAMPVINLEKKLTFDAEERFSRSFFLICCFALISFACYNLYIYFQLRDRAYLYYVIVQVGALIFFIGDNLYFNVLLPFRIYDLGLLSNGRIQHYDINYFTEHLGVAILFWGFAQFTRSYLGIKGLLTIYDKILNILAYTYFWLELIPALITISGLYYLNMAIVDNIFILVIITACITTAIVAYLHKITGAGHFLMANLLPAVFAVSSSAYILIYGVSSPIFPTMAILSQIFTFAVALVARVKFINDDLGIKAEEAMQLKIDMTTAAYERLLAEQKNEHMMATMILEQEKNELLQQKLDANQRELVGSSLHIHQKNKLLSELKAQFQNIDSANPFGQPEILQSIKSSLKDSQYLDENWDDFKLHFEQVHPRFFESLLATHPGLTTYELRLYAYFHINLSTKEIATLLNIAPASVRQAKTRLHKKMRTV